MPSYDDLYQITCNEENEPLYINFFKDVNAHKTLNFWENTYNDNKYYTEQFEGINML